MWLIVGLGNPGKKYQDTRHNLGFRTLESLKSKIKQNQPALSSKIIFFKPASWMNLSGPEVKQKLEICRLKPANLIVIYDDLDLPLGEVRFREKGSSGGHKGVQSIIDALQTEDFKRFRLGIGRPPKGKSAEEYVLEEFRASEKERVLKMIDKAVKKVIELLRFKE